MATTAALLNILLTANMAPANAALMKTQTQLKATGTTATATGAVMRKAMLGVVGATAVGLKAAYEMGEVYAQAFDKVRVGTGATGKELGKLEKSFQRVAKRTPAGMDAVGAAVADLNTRLGLTGKQLEKRSHDFLELSRITGSDVETNIRSVTRAFGDWEVKTKDQTGTLDLFLRASQNSGSSVSELADQVVQFGAPLRQVGFEMEEAVAMFALFEKAGVNTQTMMPGLKLALRGFLEDGKDPADALAAAFKGIESGAIDSSKAMEIFGARAGPDMLEAIQQGRFSIEEFLGVIENGDDTVKKASKQTTGFAEAWQRFKNTAVVELGPAFDKFFNAVGKQLQELTNAFKRGGLSEVGRVILDKIKEALPKVIQAGGKLGSTLAKEATKAFIEQPMLAGTAAGAAAIFAAGKMVGMRIGKGVAVGLALALPSLLKDLHDWVSDRRLEIRLIGANIGEWIVNALIDAVNVGIKGLNKVIEGINKIPGVDIGLIGEIGDVDFSSGIKAQIEARELREEFQRLIDKSKDLKDVGKAFQVLGGETREWKQGSIAALDAFKNKTTSTVSGVKPTLADAGRSLKGVGTDAGTMRDKSMNALVKFGNDITGAADTTDRQTGRAGNFLERLADKTGSMAKRGGGNVASLDKAISIGLGNIVEQTSKALDAFGVKKITASITSASGAVLGAVAGLQRGGSINAGKPSGDSVPALLERGEYVLNRNAVAAVGRGNLDAINFGAAARFQSGGMVTPAGQSGVVVNAAIADQVSAWLTKYKMTLTQGYNPGGPSVSPGHLVTGTALDTVPSAGWSPGPTSLFESGLRAAISAGKKVLYGSNGVGIPWPNHGFANHAHTEWGMGGAVSGAIAEKIKKVILNMPDGPLKSMGQSALDKTRAAASKYLSAQTVNLPTGAHAPAGSTYEGPLNRIFPSFVGIQNAAGHERLSAEQVAQVARGAGLPNVEQFVGIAQRESQWYPGAIGDDAAAGYGNTFGYGLWQITSGPGGQGYPNGHIIQALGGMRQMFNPVKNAQAAKMLYDAAGGMSPWAATVQRGGLIGMRGGGSAGVPKINPLWWKIGAPEPQFGMSPDLSDVRETLEKVGKLKTKIAYAEELESVYADQVNADGFITGDESALMRSILGGNENGQPGIIDYLNRQRRLITDALSNPFITAGQRTKLTTELETVQGLTGMGGKLYEARKRWTGYAPGTVDPVAADTSRSDALAAAIAESNRLKALYGDLETRQRPTLQAFTEALNRNPMPAFGGSFATGGVVPGPSGAPRTVIAHGGETITPEGGPKIELIIHDGAINASAFEARVNGVLAETIRRSNIGA